MDGWMGGWMDGWNEELPCPLPQIKIFFSSVTLYGIYFLWTPKCIHFHKRNNVFPILATFAISNFKFLVMLLLDHFNRPLVSLLHLFLSFILLHCGENCPLNIKIRPSCLLTQNPRMTSCHIYNKMQLLSRSF